MIRDDIVYFAAGIWQSEGIFLTAINAETGKVIWTNDKAGQIYINTYYSKGRNDSPAAGWKESGLGVAGLYKCMGSKTVFVDMDKRASER